MTVFGMLVAMLLGVLLCCMLVMTMRLKRVTMCHLMMVRSLMMVTSLVGFMGFMVVMGCSLVMLCCV